MTKLFFTFVVLGMHFLISAQVSLAVPYEPEGGWDDLKRAFWAEDAGFDTEAFECAVAKAFRTDTKGLYTDRIAKIVDERKFQQTEMEKSQTKLSLGGRFSNWAGNLFYSPADAEMDWAVLSASVPAEISNKGTSWFTTYNHERWSTDGMEKACRTKGSDISLQKNYVNKTVDFQQRMTCANDKTSNLEATWELKAIDENTAISSQSHYSWTQFGKQAGPLVKELITRDRNSLTPLQLFEMGMEIYKDPFTTIAMLSKLHRMDTSLNRCKFRNAVLASRMTQLFKTPVEDYIGAAYHFWGYLTIGLAYEGSKETCSFSPNAMSWGYECVVQRLDMDDRASDKLALKLAENIKAKMDDFSSCQKK